MGYLFSEIKYMYKPSVTFHKSIIATCPHQKHLVVVFHLELDFSIHVELSVCVPRKALLTIYKSFVRFHFNYSYIFYDKPGNLNSEIEKVQYKACIAITVDI